jgi:hypothetical protein
MNFRKEGTENVDKNHKIGMKPILYHRCGARAGAASFWWSLILMPCGSGSVNDHLMAPFLT